MTTHHERPEPAATFEPAEPGRLADQEDLLDAEGQVIYLNSRHTLTTGRVNVVAWLVRSPFTQSMHDQAVARRRAAEAVSVDA